jgi:type II secretory pathway pseudopilin PulG
MRTTVPPPSARSGFSLIEVVVAMMLLVFVIGSLSVLATRTSERARRADIIAKRNYIVVQQLNRYAVIPYDTLRARINSNPSALDTIKGYNILFLRRDTVMNYPTSAVGDTLVARVRVTIVPLTVNPKDTLMKDSVVLHRRNPNRGTPLFTP